MSSFRTKVLTRGMTAAGADNSLTPIPISTGAASAIEAAPRHTPTQRPCARAFHGPGDQTQHRRMERVHVGCQRRVQPAHRQRVLRRLVGADRKEIRLRGQPLGHYRGRRHLHHDAELHRVGAAQLGLLLPYYRAGGTQFCQAGDHWQHDLALALGPRPQDRAQLRSQQVRSCQTHPDAADAEFWGRIAPGQFSLLRGARAGTCRAKVVSISLEPPQTPLPAPPAREGGVARALSLPLGEG